VYNKEKVCVLLNRTDLVPWCCSSRTWCFCGRTWCLGVVVAELDVLVFLWQNLVL